MVNKDVDDTTIRGKTFWDIASRMGKRVCIMPHLLGYPPWSVNGVMVGRSGITKKAYVCPQSVIDDYNVSEFRWDLDHFPGRREKDAYIDRAKKQIERETKIAMQLLKELEWDLFFVSFGELDILQYSYWNYYDEGDPTYRANNRYKRVIPEFYQLYDEIIARFVATTDADTTTIVVSDHGIGSRPVNLVNLNESLREIGMITIQNGKKSATRSVSPSARLKLSILKAVDKYELGNFAAKALRMFPKGKDWIVSSNPIDRKNSIAYMTDQSGIKNYPYGGIQVNTENVEEGDYEQVRDSIIEALLEITDPRTGKRVMKWAVKREELYEGAYIERYPDILFELDDGYCAGMMTPAPMFGRSIMHNISPGYHKQHHAVFLVSNVQERNISKKEATLMDVAPTILDLLGIDWRRYDFDGRSIFGK
jgi:predicted AlkP superfamily phosphohydrolase/phosphomutase